MPRRLSHLSSHADRQTAGSPASTYRLLLVEPGPFLSVLARDLPGSVAMVLCHYKGFDRSLVARVMPDYVVAPLFSAKFDIVEVAAVLAAADYDGGLMLVSPPLPNWRLVVNEIQALCRRSEVTFAEHAGDSLHWYGDWS